MKKISEEKCNPIGNIFNEMEAGHVKSCTSDNVVLTFLQAWPGVVTISSLAPEDRNRATSLHKGQSVVVHVDQLLCLHIVSHMAISVHSSTLVPHPCRQRCIADYLYHRSRLDLTQTKAQWYTA